LLSLARTQTGVVSRSRENHGCAAGALEIAPSFEARSEGTSTVSTRRIVTDHHPATSAAVGSDRGGHIHPAVARIIQTVKRRLDRCRLTLRGVENTERAVATGWSTTFQVGFGRGYRLGNCSDVFPIARSAY